MAKVTKTTATKTKTTTQLDLFEDVELSDKQKTAVRRAVGDFLLEQILSTIEGAKSPIQGESFSGLSKDYKKHKKGLGLPGKANMELTGKMLDSLKYEPISEGIEIGIFNSNAPKADGHNNFSGKSSLPQRRFLPGKGQSFKSPINKEINRIVAEHVAEKTEITEEEASTITSKVSMRTLLSAKFPGLTASAAKDAILVTPKLFDLFSGLSLLRFL